MGLGLGVASTALDAKNLGADVLDYLGSKESDLTDTLVDLTKLCIDLTNTLKDFQKKGVRTTPFFNLDVFNEPVSPGAPYVRFTPEPHR
jgi:hypothetical protein